MVRVRDNITIQSVEDVRVYLPSSALNDSDNKEFAARNRWISSASSKTDGRVLFEHVTSKADFMRTFEKVKRTIDVRPGHAVLELGASHGWASVIIKDDCPDAHVVTSDVVPDCVRHCKRYEGLVGRTVDEKWAFSVRDIPFSDAQFDRVFTFAAFHHFSDHGDYTHCMSEICRLLKPDGKLVLLYEPTSPAYLYRLAYNRINKKRSDEGVDEDVLVVDKLNTLARRHGLTVQATPFPLYQYRGSAASTLYYYALAKLGLSRSLICTANFVLQKH